MMALAARAIDRLGIPEGEPAHDALARRIAVGVTIASVPSSILLATLHLVGDHPAAFLANGVLVLWIAGCLLAYVVRPDAKALTHIVLVGNQFSQLVAGIGAGGLVASGVAPMWGITAPLLALVVSGTRAALFWLVVHLVTLTVVALVDRDTDLAFGTWLNLVAVSVFVFGGMAVFVYQRGQALQFAERERLRADGLLFDVLPTTVANRLKRGDVVIDHAPTVSVLFADIAGFTSMSSEMPPEAVVRMLDAYFLAVDALAEQYGIEKVKTIGDCVMCMSGLPDAHEKPSLRLARFALALRELTESRTFEDKRLLLRIGLHTGPVVASVVGKKRFLYDVWGDTVNTASRMESTGKPGAVQVSDAVRAELGDGFVLEDRGDIEIKGKGTLHTWWLVGLAA